jgi:ribosomal protein S18 acetylase RimI-like enzyme
MIEQITQVTDELCAALERLMPQLNPTVPIPNRAQLAMLINSPASTLFIARGQDGQIAGMLTVVVFSTPTGTHAWIEDVVVDEKARGQGLGAALTQAGMQHAAACGAKSVDLTSRPSRVAANQLYQRLGFQLRESNLYRYSF